MTYRIEDTVATLIAKKTTDAYGIILPNANRN